MIARVLCLLSFALFAPTAFAHKPSDSYLGLNVGGNAIDGHWDIAARDLDAVFDLDRNADGKIDWGELNNRSTEIDAYALSRLGISSGGSPCVLAITDHQVDRHTDGGYLVLDLHATCPAHIDSLDVDYGLLFDIDAQHRGLLKLETASASVTSAVFSASSRRQSFAMGGLSAWTQLRGYVGEGIEHIATGFDHLLFLVALLLPSVLIRRGRH
ncbi:MAG TPA: HupE/UreJ family protein, partial [Rhodanobacteraceae bacterium]|nr:HupE/UreJ family protein [Rhodanobacteraceae bacterium]